MNKNVLLGILWTAAIASAVLCNLFNIDEKMNLLNLISMLSAMIAGIFILININKNLYLKERKKYEYYLSKFTLSIPIIFGIILSYAMIFLLVNSNYSLSLAIIFWIAFISIKKSREPRPALVIKRKIKPNNNKIMATLKIVLFLVSPIGI